MNANANWQQFLARKSFIELGARERARAVLDSDSFREIVGPFDRLKSPWLPLQGIVAQADDGVVIARGTIDGKSAVVAAIEGAFQGGSMGEVAGAKIAGALELARRDCENGTPTRAVLLLETGGVRLQEANLGLAAIAEIHAGIVALRRHVPVVGVIAGLVGCFGGMSLAAALCSYLIVTREARLGMNGPEVIEQEAGIAELDASDRTMIWDLIGGTQRSKVGMVDRLIVDDTSAVVAAVHECFVQGIPVQHRTEDVDRFLARLAAVDTSKQYDGAALQTMWKTDASSSSSAPSEQPFQQQSQHAPSHPTVQQGDPR